MRLRGSDWRVWAAVATVLVLIAGSFPFWGGAIGARLARATLAQKLGVGVAVGSGRAGLLRIVLRDVRIGQHKRAPLAVIGRLEVPYTAAWGGGRVFVDRARFEIERGGSNDNVSQLLDRLRGGPRLPKQERKSYEAGRERKLPAVSVRGSDLRTRDIDLGVAVVVQGLDVDLTPDKHLVVETDAFAGMLRLRGREGDPKFGAAHCRLSVPLEKLRPQPVPDIAISGGYVQLLPTLGLTGIKGTVAPAAGQEGSSRAGGAAEGRVPLVVDLKGSYGGAKESLWTAVGKITPPAGETPPEGSLALRAARFSLNRIKDILPPTVLEPDKTSVDAELTLTFAEGLLSFAGNLEVSHLSLHHEAVAPEPVMGLNLALGLDGRLDLGRRRLELVKLEGRSRSLVGTLSGAVELAPGVFTFTDGTTMPMVPKIELRLQVPKIACNRLLESIPPAIIPHLRGFDLKGIFEADVYTKIDYADLEALELGGKVNINGCKVLEAPEQVLALAEQESITHMVDIPSANKDAPPDSTELLAFTIGPENPDFVPYDQLSPYLINSIMTTEDSGFFRHRGWVSPEFRTALKRNLAGGGFRLGASSITMQMVKNVLLSREKTLSRKLQELFLVWYVEKLLSKERILELYFNAIEFGPRIYGIGAAARHYFGKTAAEITPLEAAFISSMLPSPKRRYVQYCQGELSPRWEKYVRRILTRAYQRGRLTDDEYAFALAQPLTFNLTERKLETGDCLAWVKNITTRGASRTALGMDDAGQDPDDEGGDPQE